MIGSPIGLALQDLATPSAPARFVKELVPRLLARGFEARVVCARRPEGDWNLEDGRPVPLERAGLPLWSEGLRAGSFDRGARRKLVRWGAQLLHGFGDLSIQDVMTVCSLDDARAEFVPGGRPIPGWVRRLRRRQWGQGGARIFLAPSQMVKQHLTERHGIPSMSVRVVRPGVDAARFTPEGRGESRFTLRRSAGWTDELRIVVTAVGRDPARRNLGLLTETVDRLANRAPVALCVVGTANWRRDPPAIRLARRARFFHVPHTNHIEHYLRAADVVAQPSFYDEFGETALEALACGTPVLVGHRVGAGEILTPGVDGVVLKDMASPALAGVALTTAWGLDREACRKTAEKYTWDAHADQVAKIYQELL